MNESTSPLTPELACFRHLLGLKFALAGDLESADAIELLRSRINAIDWEDAAFIKFSEEMRDGLPRLTSEQEASLGQSLPEIIHLQAERLAQANETAAGLLPSIIQISESRKQDAEKMDKLLAFAEKVLRVHFKMIDRLQLLGADTSEFQIPKKIL